MSTQTNPSGQGRLADSIDTLPRIGTQRAAQLRRLKIDTVEDLLLHKPRRYEDRNHFSAIAEARDQIPSVFRVTLQTIRKGRGRSRHRGFVEARVTDGSGEMTLRWWNQPYMARLLNIGTEYLVYGSPSLSGETHLDHPELEPIDDPENEEIHLHRWVPIYRLTKGLSQRWLRQLIWNSLKALEGELTDRFRDIHGPGGLNREAAIRQLHFPTDRSCAEAASRFLARDELTQFQLSLQERRLRFIQQAQAPACHNSNRLVSPFLKALPFHLTKSQEAVLREIREAMNQSFPMRRLLQGDVGCGKTVVATLSALMMLESQSDVALLVPTELLAQQHFQTIGSWFQGLEVGLELLTANENERLNESRPRLTVGTHALLEAGYAPEHLGLVIIDEQHRFGVTQRNRLLRKGSHPHLLTMTATPIPRSLGLTVYGDLDHSILRESPGGRGRISTHVRSAPQRELIWKFIRDKLAEGRQAYVIYPRIESDEAGTVTSIAGEAEAVARALGPARIGCVHGRLDRAESARIMEAFRTHHLQVLVATSMIEVGVDVANATVMLIENAERFGLAQLHQMRGRIGRGSHDAHCILIHGSDSESARERLEVLQSSLDGFVIADYDLESRGPGEFLGRQQSGLPRFRFADLTRDRHLVSEVRDRVRDHLGLTSSGARPVA